MAVGIHIAKVAFLAVNPVTGQPIKRTGTIAESLKSEHRHVIIPDATIPNSANYPTIDEYLKLEAASDYVVHHLSQTTVITYDVGNINAAT